MKRTVMMTMVVVMVVLMISDKALAGPWTDSAFGGSSSGSFGGYGGLVQVIPQILAIGANERIENKKLEIIDKATGREETQAVQAESQSLLEREQLRGQVQKLQDENQRLRDENARLQKRLDELEKKFDRLIEQLSQKASAQTN